MVCMGKGVREAPLLTLLANRHPTVYKQCTDRQHTTTGLPDNSVMPRTTIVAGVWAGMPVYHGRTGTTAHACERQKTTLKELALSFYQKVGWS